VQHLVLRETEKGIHVGTLITKFHERIEEFEMKLSKMNVQDIIALNREVICWFNDNSESLKSGLSKETAAQYTYNLQRYLETIPAEAMAEFYHIFAEDNKTKAWPRIVLSLNREIAAKMVDAIRGDNNKPKQN